jgi:hypothetical protein
MYTYFTAHEIEHVMVSTFYPLKLSGYNIRIYHLLQRSEAMHAAQKVFLCSVWFSQQRGFVSLNIINLFFFIVET